MLFELHSQGAYETAVPKQLVDGKNRNAINRLMLRLFDMGYRVVNVEINIYDKFCAEIAVAKMKGKHSQ